MFVQNNKLELSGRQEINHTQTQPCALHACFQASTSVLYVDKWPHMAACLEAMFVLYCTCPYAASCC